MHCDSQIMVLNGRTSDKGTTSEQWTKCSSPPCPLFEGSTVYHTAECLHNTIRITQRNSLLKYAYFAPLCSSTVLELHT